MNRHILVAATLALALMRPALAHQVWLERDGADGVVRLYFGEPGEGLRERAGSHLDLIAAPQAVGAPASAQVQREADNVAFIGLPAGDVRVVEASIAPRPDRAAGGRTKGVFQAREGRSATTAAMDLELVPVTAGGDTFRLMLRGQPLPRAAVTLVAPPGWEKSLRTDAEGQVTFPTPWAGRYVAEVIHTEQRAGGEGEGAYDRIRHVSTLSFVTTAGIPWQAPAR